LIVSVSFIEAEGLLVQIAKHVEAFDRNIGAADRPFQQCSKVFSPVCVDIPAHVAFSMTDKIMNEVAVLG
jgi:hypothetical protein